MICPYHPTFPNIFSHLSNPAGKTIFLQKQNTGVKANKAINHVSAFHCALYDIGSTFANSGNMLKAENCASRGLASLTLGELIQLFSAQLCIQHSTYSKNVNDCVIVFKLTKREN